jgi:lysophospholipase L1-like esterase
MVGEREKRRFAGLAAPSERLGRALLLLVSLAFVCAAAEVGLRLAGYQALYDVYSKPELFWQHDERLGWSLEPGARGRYRGPRPFPMEFDSTIEINSLGLRGPDLPLRRSGELRVVVLGDSFVAGFEVEQQETFSALLEAELRGRFDRPLHVINAGVRGYGTDQSLLWFRERGRGLRPDLVVAVFSANDFEDNVTLHRVRRPFGKGAFALRPSGALELIGVPVPRYELCSAVVLNAAYDPVRIDGALSRAACTLQARLADHSALFTLLSTGLARLPALVRLLQGLGEPDPEGAALSAAWRATRAEELRVAGVPAAAAGSPERSALEGELTTALLQALASDVRASGARFLLLMTPRHWERVDLRALRADQIDPRFVSLPTGIRPGQIRFRNDSHLNAFGHRVLADRLAPLVESELRSALRVP